MKALITGASSGIGRDIAIELANRGYSLVLVARRMGRLKDIKNIVDVEWEVICCDLSVAQNCINLCEQLPTDIDVVVNSAGFGVFGEFIKTDLDREIDMINTNITALHIITKHFVKKFVDKNYGYILNVSSAAAYAPGPMFSSYYATKAYVLRLTQAIEEEVRDTGVYIGTLCPGTVNTEFNTIANAGNGVTAMPSAYVAKYAVEKMFEHKTVIIPGIKFKCAVFFSKFIPESFLAKITFNFQKKKNNS